MELEINGRTVETDAEGYLVNLEDWSPEVAEYLAAQDKLPLSENHWKIINYMRDYFNLETAVDRSLALVTAHG